MRRGPRLLSIVAFCIVLASNGSRPIRAQDSNPPDLQMLLNLDLFRPQSQQSMPETPGAASSDSILDQIRTLNALGYLGNTTNPNAAFGNGGPEPSAAPPSQGIPE
jgi:hypothetical protein